MTKDLINFGLWLLAFTAVLWGVHFYVLYNFFSEAELQLPLWTIYFFNATLVFIVFAVIRYRVEKANANAFTMFLLLTSVKMLLAIVFLLPLFTGKSSHKTLEVFNFFIPYFCFLTFEIYMLDKFFKKQ